MNRKKISLVLVNCLLFVITACNKSDDPEAQEKIEINDNSVESADVNAPDYWDTVELVWSDEFEGSSLDKNKWLFETFEQGPGSKELQTYVVDDNVEVGGGTLKVLAKKIGEGGNKGDYTTVRLNGKFAFKYGRLEVRAKMPAPKGNGLWSKLWMLGTNITTVGYPRCGEIDLVEYVSHLPNRFYNTVHTAQNSGNTATSGPLDLESTEEEFHNYGVLWTHEYLKFYVDDINNITYTFERPDNATDDNWPFSKSFYFLMNIVVGGEFGGAEGVNDAAFPNMMEVDYVRVYHAK